MSETLICPATRCPFLGLEDGSVWTGEQADPCTDDCGWRPSGHCIAHPDLVTEYYRILDESEHELDELEIPPCELAGDCKWQQQAEVPVCAPRLAEALGQPLDLGGAANG